MPLCPSTTRQRAIGEILVGSGTIDETDVLLAAHEQDLGDPRRLGEILLDKGQVSPDDLEAALRVQGAEGSPLTRTDFETEEAPVDPATFPQPQSARIRALQAIVLLALVLIAALVLTSGTGGVAFGVALYGVLSLPYLLAKLVLSLRYRAVDDEVPTDATVSVVVPFLNEDPATFERCLVSILNQTSPALAVYLIDDGSRSRACYEIARRFAARDATIVVHRFSANRGKRAAQGWAFSQATTSMIATVDSDTILRSDALAEALKPFSDSRVKGVCGYARGLNANHNLLTRLIDLRYTNSFLYERAAYSVLGSVLCSTGVLSVWRRDLVMAHLDDYLSQRFMGNEVHYGDDRRMTAYALRTGRVVLQDSAIALTALPETMPHFIRQQIRWNKSFFRESLLLMRQLRPTRVGWWLGTAEFGYWMVLTTMLLYAVVVRPISETQLPSWRYVVFLAVMAYARSIRMIGDRGRLLPLSFLLAPIYGVMNLVLLVPLRLYSVARLRDGSWGTRKRKGGLRRLNPVDSRIDSATADRLPELVVDVPASTSIRAPAVDPAFTVLPPSGFACDNILPVLAKR